MVGGEHDTPWTCLCPDPEHQNAGKDQIKDVALHYFGCLGSDKVRKTFYESLPDHKKLRIKDEKSRVKKLREVFEQNADEETKKRLKELRLNLNKLLDSEWTNRSGKHGSYKDLNQRSHPHEEQDPLPRTSRTSKDLGYGIDAKMIIFKDSKPFKHDGYVEDFPNQKVPIHKLLYNESKKENPIMQDYEEKEIRYFHLPCNNMVWVEEAIARRFEENRPTYEGPFRRPLNPTKTEMILRSEFWRGQQHGGRHDPVHARHMRPRCDIISTDSESTESAPPNLVLYMPYLHWETDRRRIKFDETMRTITENHKAKNLLAIQTGTRQSGRTTQNQTAENGTPTSRAQTATNGNTHLTANLNSTPAAERQSRPTIDTTRYGSQNSRSMTEVVDAKREKEVKKANKQKPPFIPKTILGRVLFGAALVSEAMAYFHEQELLKDFLHHEPPMHPRRTLDQSHYWTLKTTKRRDRDQVVYRGTVPNKDNMPQTIICRGQRGIKSHCEKCPSSKGGSHGHQSCNGVVARRGEKPLARADKHCRQCESNHFHRYENCPITKCEHCRTEIRKVPRVVMVDQLWLWILDGNSNSMGAVFNFYDDTIITSFPRRYGRNKPDPSAVHKGIRERLKLVRGDEIKTAYDLALIIIDQCSRVFFDRSKTADRQPQVMDLFANAIGRVTNYQAIAYEHFWHYTEVASKIYQGKDSVETAGMSTDSLLDINPEGKLLREIKDILDELSIMLEIKNQQHRVLDEFKKHAKHILLPQIAEAEEQGTAKPPPNTDKNRQVPSKEGAQTMSLAQDLLAELQYRIADLNNLQRRAERTEAGLKDLMALKQQQAGVVQAREAVRQADETLRQGRSIMLFTVITIVFLPLSFCASIFGMNNVELGSGQMHLREQFKYMFPISTGLIATSFILAFSSFTRSIVSCGVSIAWFFIATKSRLYGAWVDNVVTSKSLNERTKKKVREMKEKAQREKQERCDVAIEKETKKDNKRGSMSIDTASGVQMNDLESGRGAMGENGHAHRSF